MGLVNYMGIAVVVLILIPNIVYMIKSRNSAPAVWKNKTAEIFEGIGRFGCIAFMIVNVPHTWFGFWFLDGFPVFVIANAVLALAYIILWIVLWEKDCVFKALALSIVPSMIFLVSGVLILSIPLIVSAVMFAAAHILISYKSVKLRHG